MSIFNIGKKKSKQPISDAVRFPDVFEKHILEDHEMAAYHNQAWFSTFFQQILAVSINCQLIRKKQLT